jgi:dTDP-4-dehydrorhamnose reductase
MMQQGGLKVLITGALGQLGSELRATAPETLEIISCSSAELDVTQADTARALIRRAHPDVIIHAAAYTDVDGAEREPARAHAVNAAGSANIAAAASEVGARMIYISTDYVFDGGVGRPYAPDDAANPLSVYGRSKLVGEQAVLQKVPGRSLVVRTAWVYSVHGRNFVQTMLSLMNTQKSVGVVADQVGTPTWARPLAQALWRAAELSSLNGIVHWTDAGVASWYDFAIAIQEEGLAAGHLTHCVTIHPLVTLDFPRPARRPSYSVLDKTTGWSALGGPAAHWRSNLRCMLQALPHA